MKYYRTQLQYRATSAEMKGTISLVNLELLNSLKNEVSNHYLVCSMGLSGGGTFSVFTNIRGWRCILTLDPNGTL